MRRCTLRSLLLISLILVVPMLAAAEAPDESSVAKLRRIKAQVEQGVTETSVEVSAEPAQNEPSIVWKALEGLCLSIGLFFILVYFFKKSGSSKIGAVEKRIKMQERLSMGGKTSVALLAIDGKDVLVGVSENNITLLKELSPAPVSAISKPIPLKDSQVVKCINE